MFEIKIKTETKSEAFADNWRYEVARILYETAGRIDTRMETTGNIHDTDGNQVGSFSYTPAQVKS